MLTRLFYSTRYEADEESDDDGSSEAYRVEPQVGYAVKYIQPTSADTQIRNVSGPFMPVEHYCPRSHKKKKIFIRILAIAIAILVFYPLIPL